MWLFQQENNVGGSVDFKSRINSFVANALVSANCLCCQFSLLRQMPENGSYRLYTEDELEQRGRAFADEKEIKWEAESKGQMHLTSFIL